MNGKRFYYTLLQEYNTIWNVISHKREKTTPYLKLACGSTNNGSLDGRVKYTTAHIIVKNIMERESQGGFILYYGKAINDCIEIATHKVNYNLLICE